jgi:hypothetical protein
MITIKISSIGKSSLADVSEFVLFIWNIKVLQQFLDLIEKSSEQLKKNPNLGIPFTKSIRKIVLHKNASMYYEYDDINKVITILLFIDNRQNPKDYLKLL